MKWKAVGYKSLERRLTLLVTEAICTLEEERNLFSREMKRGEEERERKRKKKRLLS